MRDQLFTARRIKVAALATLAALSLAYSLHQIPARAAEPKSTDGKLSVVDEKGHPVPKFEIMICGAGGYVWKPGADGVFALPKDLSPAFLVARADGHASTIVTLDGEKLKEFASGKGSLTLPHGEEVELKLTPADGAALPKDLKPEVTFQELSDLARMLRNPRARQMLKTQTKSDLDFNVLNMHPGKGGGYVLRLDPKTPEVIVSIDQPGFLRSADVGPLSPANAKNGIFEVKLPKPARLTINFDAGPVEKRSFKAARMRLLAQQKDAQLAEMGDEVDILKNKTATFTDLPPGDYWVTLKTSPQSGPDRHAANEEADPGRFMDQRKLSLAAGRSEEVDLKVSPFDPDSFRGKRTAVVSIQTADGQPAAGRDAKITFLDDHYGMITVFTGKVPESGEITLKDITDAKGEALGAASPERYQVEINGKSAGSFGFIGSEPSEKFVIQCVPGVGDFAPNVEIVNADDGKTMKLNDLRGKVVVLDFWATWCGPCQPALAELNKMAAENAADWKDRVTIAPISIDQDAAMAKEHLANAGWTKLHTYWTGPQGPALKAFAIDGVPTTILLDPAGRILWRGHPMDTEGGMDLQGRIQAAIK